MQLVYNITANTISPETPDIRAAAYASLILVHRLNICNPVEVFSLYLHESIQTI